jgi:mannosyltransferase OCH1-like enzyme
MPLLWSYWEGRKPEIVHRSIQSWRTYLPEWEIHVLDPVSVLNSVPSSSHFSEYSPATRADIIRLQLLYKFGGLWMDATILLRDGLDWLSKYDDQELFAFTKNSASMKSLFIENWL